MTALPIIVVEDDPVDAHAIRRALKGHRQGIELTIYANADDLLADQRVLASHGGTRPLLILDLNLPGTGGISVLNQLRDDNYQAALPAVILTTSNDHRDRDAALQLGAAGYFIKPLDHQELITLLDDIISYWRRSLGLEP